MKLRIKKENNNIEQYYFQIGNVYSITSNIVRLDKFILDYNREILSNEHIILLDMGIFNCSKNLNVFLRKYSFETEEIYLIIEDISKGYFKDYTYPLKYNANIMDINMQVKAILLIYILLKINNSIIFYNIPGLSIDTAQKAYQILYDKISNTNRICCVLEVGKTESIIIEKINQKYINEYICLRRMG